MTRENSRNPRSTPGDCIVRQPEWVRESRKDVTTSMTGNTCVSVATVASLLPCSESVAETHLCSTANPLGFARSILNVPRRREKPTERTKEGTNVGEKPRITYAQLQLPGACFLVRYCHLMYVCDPAFLLVCLPAPLSVCPSGSTGSWRVKPSLDLLAAVRVCVILCYPAFCLPTSLRFIALSRSFF